MEHELIKKRFNRAESCYEEHALVQKKMAHRLLELTKEHCAVLGIDKDLKILELGAGTGYFSRLLAALYPKEVTVNDLSPKLCRTAAQAYAAYGLSAAPLSGNMDEISLEKSFNLIASNAAVQWSTDPAALMLRLSSILESPGLIALSVFLPGTLHELYKHLKEKPMVTYLEADDLIKNSSLEILCCKTWTEKLSFLNAKAALKHLSLTGVTAVRDRPLSAPEVKALLKALDEECEKDKRTMSLTFNCACVLLANKNGN